MRHLDHRTIYRMVNALSSSISYSGWNADYGIKVFSVKHATHISILLIIQEIYVKITRIYSRNTRIAIEDICNFVIKMRQRSTWRPKVDSNCTIFYVYSC